MSDATPPFLVSVSPDGLVAYLARNPNAPRSGGMEEALAALREAGVVEGIDPKSVSEVVASLEGGSFIPVARGRQPVHGADASLDHLYDLSGVGRPRELEGGRVDLLDLGIVQNVTRGTTLVRKQPATAGEPGVTVRGEVLPARPGLDRRLPQGKGTEVSPDGLLLLAAADGHLVVREGKVEIHEVLEIRGDVDLSTGQIQFIGSVVVRGNITDGLRVRAEGHVDVYGAVDSGHIQAGGHAIVRSGIQGGFRGQVVAQGDVSARFIENATVRAGGVVRVGDAIVQSEVDAGIRVQVTDGRGAIVGGRVRARDEVLARLLGSPMATPTAVEVGMDPASRERLSNVRKRLTELERQASQTDAGVRYLVEQEQSGGLSPERKALLLKSAQALRQMAEQLEALRAERDRLESELELGRRARVRVQERVYPGCQIKIMDAQLSVTDELPPVSFYLDEHGEVAMGPF